MSRYRKVLSIRGGYREMAIPDVGDRVRTAEGYKRTGVVLEADAPMLLVLMTGYGRQWLHEDNLEVIEP